MTGQTRSGLPPALTVLYRGPLESCNYACGYCPFAKKPATATEREADGAALQRFLEWALAAPTRLSVFFTPWGEALHHRRYQDAIVALSRSAGVDRVAIQTNLAADPRFLARADTAKVGLWVTYHPTQVSLEKFLRRCAALDDLGVRYSVGAVGRRDHIPAIEELRSRLTSRVPLWVNAFSVDGGPARPGYYDQEAIGRLTAVDPLFGVGLLRFASAGRACAAGHTAITVDGDGDVRRCHFIPRRLGNLYRDDLASILAERPCTRSACDCHIGYVHLRELRAEEVYGDGLLERFPTGPAWADPSEYLARAEALSRRPSESQECTYLRF